MRNLGTRYKRGMFIVFSLVSLILFSNLVFAGGGSDPGTPCEDFTTPNYWGYKVWVGSNLVRDVSEVPNSKTNVLSLDIGSNSAPLDYICAVEGQVKLLVGTRDADTAGDDPYCETYTDNIHQDGVWDVHDGTTYYIINWDGDPNDCKCITGASDRWALGGDIINQNCCGDDANENVRTKVCLSGCTSASDTANRACCNEDDCVWDDVCYDPIPSSSDHTGYENTAYEIISGENLALVCTANGASNAAWGNPDYYFGWCETLNTDTALTTAWNVQTGNALAEDSYYSGTGGRNDYCDIGASGHPSLECCCGDDVGENVKIKKASSDIEWATDDTPENEACCVGATDCVWQGECYSDLDIKSGLNTGGNDNIVFCGSGNDEWQDCDNDCSACGLNIANAGLIGLGEYSDFGVSGCCGDDYKEQLASCDDQSDKTGSDCNAYSSTNVCCDDFDDCVDGSGICKDAQVTPYASFGGSTCVDGVWYNLDDPVVVIPTENNGICDDVEDGISGSPSFSCDCVAVDVGDGICTLRGVCEDVTAGSIKYPLASPDDCSLVTEESVCGNGVVNFGESCDGTNFNSVTCEDYGFTGGVLSCDACEIDNSGCTGLIAGACGNDIINTGESCDGTNFNGLTCEDYGFAGGVLSCSACLVDTSTCTGGSLLCGNGIMDAEESCDGSNLNALTCDSFGFTGTLSCVGCNIDTSSCTDGVTGICGDSVLNIGESCDGSVPAGLACNQFGFVDGTLRCDNALCQIDTSGCYGSSGGYCGDDSLDLGEFCDTTELNGQSCQSLGYSSGSLTCNGDCTLDDSSCIPFRCGDGECTDSLGENYITCPQDCSLGGGSCGDDICTLGETCLECNECCNQLPSAGCVANDPCCDDDICTWGENNQICTNGDCPNEQINYAGTCGDSSCSVTEDAYICASDCDWSSCGNDVCEWGETETNCVLDCGQGNCGDADGCYGTCGDGACSLAENGLTCPQDCFNHDYASYCNVGGCCFVNDVCEWGETHSSCPSDCPEFSYCGTCGDGVCSVCEDTFSCIEDCGNYGGCGDNYCSIFEALGVLNCPQDCPFDDATQGDDGIGLNAGGDIPDGWCGNDPGEFYRYCQRGQGNPESQCGIVQDLVYNEFDACCDTFSDCVNEIGTCSPSGQGRDTFANSYCSNGRWVDPDLLQSFCEDVTGGTRNDANVVNGIVDNGNSHWLVASYDDNSFHSCCGDDSNEHYLNSIDGDGNHGDGTFGCCNETDKCVYNNKCWSEGEIVIDKINRLCGPDRKIHLAADYMVSADEVTYPVSSLSYDGTYMSCNVHDVTLNQDWTIPSECKGGVSGYVYDKWGDPLENAKVEFHRYDDWDIVYTKYTDSNGFYWFACYGNGDPDDCIVDASYYNVVIEGEVQGLYKSTIFIPAGPDTRVNKGTPDTIIPPITLSDASTCRPDCIDIDNNVCSKDCEGRNGCHFEAVGTFTSEDIANVCDLEAPGSKVSLDSDNDVFCCGSQYEASASGYSAIRGSIARVKVSDIVCSDADDQIIIRSIANIFGSPGTINVLVCK